MENINDFLIVIKMGYRTTLILNKTRNNHKIGRIN